MGKQTSLLSFTTVATVRPGRAVQAVQPAQPAQPAAPIPSAGGPGRAVRNGTADEAFSTRGRHKENEAPQLANSGRDSHGVARSVEDFNQVDVRQLVAMGFARGDCVAALAQSSHDLSAAVNKLLGGFTAASVRRDEQTSLTRTSPKRKIRQAEESLDQRLARRRVQTALSRNDDGDAPLAEPRWPLRGPARKASTAVVAVEQLERSPKPAPLAPIAGTTDKESTTGLLDDVAGSQRGTSLPLWKPLDSSMLQGAPRVLIPKLSEPGKASDLGSLPAATTVESATDVIVCPLCGARVQRGKLALHMASESVDAPLEDEDGDLEYEEATATVSARQNTDNELGAQLGATELNDSRVYDQLDQRGPGGATKEQEVIIFDSSDDEVAAADMGADNVSSDQGTNMQPEPHMGLSDGLATNGMRVEPGTGDAISAPSEIEGNNSDAAADAYSFWQPMTKKPPQAASTGQQQSIINYSAMMQPGAMGPAGPAVAAAGNGSAGRLHPEALLNPEATAAGFRVKPRARGATKKASNATSSKTGAGRGRGRGGMKKGKKWQPRGGWGKLMARRRGRG